MPSELYKAYNLTNARRQRLTLDNFTQANRCLFISVLNVHRKSSLAAYTDDHVEV